MKEAYIYSLNCPITDIPKYIGKTDDLQNRFNWRYI